jgi:hypothetical protein
MFKQLTATILLLAFVAQTFSAPFIRLDYYFNQADYAKNCVNKKRPKMHCNGQCQVMKKIQEEEKKDQEQAERKMGSKLEVLSSRSFYTNNITQGFSEPISIAYFVGNDDTEIKMPRSFFHPPSI